MQRAINFSDQQFLQTPIENDLNVGWHSPSDADDAPDMTVSLFEIAQIAFELDARVSLLSCPVREIRSADHAPPTL